MFFSVDGALWETVYINYSFPVWALSYSNELEEYISLCFDFYAPEALVCHGDELETITQNSISAESLNIQYTSGLAFGNGMWVVTVTYGYI